MSDWVAVVDDEAFCLTNARKLLGEANMRVSCLRSGRELLKFLEKKNPDLILLDIVMPEMDGFETYHAVRQYEARTGKKPTPIIFLTGEDNSETERRGLKMGASDFIRKPFNRDILLRRVHNTITNQKTIESLTEKATMDRLTGFLNKASGTTRVRELCKTESGALMILDLDNFKLVNDIYGHDMGDRVLMSFADIMRHNTRSEDVTCRIGGDEFMAFFCNISREEAVASLTARLNEQLLMNAEELMGEDFGLPLGISIGAAFVPEHGRRYEELFQWADHALYKAKCRGKHGYVIYGQYEESEKAGGEDLLREMEHVTKIVEERNEGGGALLLEQESFVMVYHFIRRFIKRYGGKTMKLLFSMKEKNPEKEVLREAMKSFGESLQKVLRRSDIILRSRSNQFFLMLPELSEADTGTVIGRIFGDWEKKPVHEEVEIKYVMEAC